jgi:long-chain acyl-CoA synthetase
MLKNENAGENMRKGGEANAAAAGSQLSLGQILRRSARLRGNSLAIADCECELTWNAFEQRVMRFAGALRAIGLTPGDRVAILAQNSHRYLETLFAVPWAGGVIAPLNFRLATTELGAILRDSGANILVIDDMHQHLARELASIAHLRHIIHAGTEPTIDGLMTYEALLDAAAPVPDSGRSGEDLAALFYTSGSTGEPKGVMHSHANIAMACFSSIPPFGLDEDAVALVAGPLFHVGATGLCFPAMMAAASIVVLPRFEPGLVIETIERYRITNMTAVPTMLRMIADHPDARRRDLSSLRTVTFGGAPMPDSLLTELLTLAPGVRFVHCYGVTETTASCSSLPPRYVLAASRHLGKALSIGRALLGHDIAILDSDDRELGPGAIGEIAVRGPIVTRGYWRKPELSARALRGGWLHTGDVGYLDEDGFLYIVDRLKDMIITGGENVYSREVEEVVYGFAGVAQCAVIGVPDERWGERVHAIVTPSVGRSVDPEALIAHCRARIAGYKCPRSVEVRAEPLPMSGANKINKSELRAPYWAKRHSQLV